MSKVEQIMEEISRLASDQEAKDAKLEGFFIVASKVENQIAFNFNMEPPELAMLLYSACLRSDEFRSAIQAVNSQLQEDQDRRYAKEVNIPITTNKIVS